MGKIKIAIAGVGNCASSLMQGLYYYKDVNSAGELVPGLMHNVFGNYKISDIEIVAAFDIDARKVGKDVSEAIFAKPNCTKVFYADIPKINVPVRMAPVLDGVANHMKDHPEERTFVISKEKPCDVAAVLKETKPDILLNYLPVGSEEAVKYYAECCLEAGVAMINCMPVFIASDPVWEKRFAEKGIPIIGDDIKAQIGSTVVHRVLTKLFSDRGVKIDQTYQLNVGGNTDFLNMIAKERLKSKKISKTQAVQSVLPAPLHHEKLHIGPSDYVPWLNDNKLGFIRIEGRKFGDIPVNLELRLSVEDSPNSAGCAIDAIRAAKLALDRKIGGALTSISSYTMKSPPQQFPENLSKEMIEEFIRGERER
jgi:myo-inositol-1-phosphate synthase